MSLDPPSLEQVRFFKRMRPEERAEIARMMRRVTFAAGQTLNESGVPLEGLFVIESGRIQVSMRLPGDAWVDLWVGGPGDVAGEPLLAVGASQTLHVSVQVTALEPTVVWLLERSLVASLRVQRHPLVVPVMSAAVRTACARARFVLGQRFGRPPAEPGAHVSAPLQPASPLSEADHRLLRVVPLFHGVTAEAATAESAPFLRRELQRGDPLLAEGSPGGPMRLVLRGAVETSIRRDGTKHRVAINGPGRLVGEIAFIDGKPEPVDAIAKERTTLLELSRSALDALLAARDPFGFRILESIALQQWTLMSSSGRRFVHAEVQASSSTTSIDGRLSVRSA